MRVRILSGNGAGTETEVDDVLGESMLHTGFAERVADVVAEAPAVEAQPPKRPPAKPRTKRAE